MRLLPVLVALFLVACEGNPKLDQEITLAFSEQKTIEDEALTLTFTALNEESRCPGGTQCAWAGQATITIEASKPGTSPASFALTVPSPNTTSYSGYSITLVDLAPYPTAGHQAAPEEYVATLLVTRQ